MTLQTLSDADVKAELIGRAQDLTELVAGEAAETDRRGSVSPTVIEAFNDAGFMKMLVPKRYGGYELDIDTMSKVVRTIAPSCTSTAWVLAFFIGHNWLHALFPERSQDEVFAKRSFALSPGTFAPSFSLTPTKGGYIAKGRSSWNSGTQWAEYFLSGGLVMEDGKPPSLKFFLTPRSDVTVIDNWDIAGLRGTTSHDIAIDDVFVPDYHTVDAAQVMEGTTPGSALHSNPLYSMPVFPFIVGEILPVAVGTYASAAAEFKRVTKNRVMNTGARADSKQTTRIVVGKGDAGVKLADSMLDGFIDFLDTADLETLRDPLTRGRMKAQGGMITDFCRAGVNELVATAGANAYRFESSLQRNLRDINLMSTHATLDMGRAAETYGEILLGLPPQAPF